MLRQGKRPHPLPYRRNRRVPLLETLEDRATPSTVTAISHTVLAPCPELDDVKIAFVPQGGTWVDSYSISALQVGYDQHTVQDTGAVDCNPGTGTPLPVTKVELYKDSQYAVDAFQDRNFYRPGMTVSVSGGGMLADVSFIALSEAIAPGDYRQTAIGYSDGGLRLAPLPLPGLSNQFGTTYVVGPAGVSLINGEERPNAQIQSMVISPASRTAVVSYMAGGTAEMAFSSNRELTRVDVVPHYDQSQSIVWATSMNAGSDPHADVGLITWEGEDGVLHDQHVLDFTGGTGSQWVLRRDVNSDHNALAPDTAVVFAAPGHSVFSGQSTVLEAEDGTGAGISRNRREASGHAPHHLTQLLLDGQSRTLKSFSTAVAGWFYAFARYSADNPTPPILTTDIDGQFIRSFTTQSTTVPGQLGAGWDRFVHSPVLGPFYLNVGAHQVRLGLSGGGQYGAEIDTVTLFQATVSQPATPPQSIVQFAAPALQVSEHSRTLLASVTRTGRTAGTATVVVRTADGSARAGTDYRATATTLEFADGEKTKTVAVPILNDRIYEGTESFRIILSTPGSGTGLGPIREVLVKISDDDPKPAKLLRVVTVAATTGTPGNGSTVTISFTIPLDPARAGNVANFRLISAGRDGRFGTPDDVRLAIRRATYDPALRRIRLTTSFLAVGTTVALIVNGRAPQGLVDIGSRLLDGDGDGKPGGNFSISLRVK